ncbi:hypothetical protein GCM10027320_22240 [Massilia solisilvae]
MTAAPVGMVTKVCCAIFGLRADWTGAGARKFGSAVLVLPARGAACACRTRGQDLPTLQVGVAGRVGRFPAHAFSQKKRAQSRISSARFRLSAASEPTAPDSRYRLT